MLDCRISYIKSIEQNFLPNEDFSLEDYTIVFADEIRQIFMEGSATLVKKYMTKFPKTDLFDYYRQLITQPKILKQYSNNLLDDPLLAYICSYSESLINKKYIELEDLAALAFMKQKTFGFDQEIDIKYA